MVKLARLLAFPLSIVTLGVAAPLPLEAPDGTPYNIEVWNKIGARDSKAGIGDIVW